MGLDFGLIFIGFYLVLSLRLISYHLMAEQVSSRSPPKLLKNRGKNQKFNKNLLGLSTGLVALSFIMTTVIFITFPRST